MQPNLPAGADGCRLPMTVEEQTRLGLAIETALKPEADECQPSVLRRDVLMPQNRVRGA